MHRETEAGPARSGCRAPGTEGECAFVSSVTVLSAQLKTLSLPRKGKGIGVVLG